MNARDRQRLARILGLTGSTHDGEALAAVRKANAQIVAADVTWDEILRPPDDLRIAVDAAKSPPGRERGVAQ